MIIERISGYKCISEGLRLRIIKGYLNEGVIWGSGLVKDDTSYHNSKQGRISYQIYTVKRVFSEAGIFRNFLNLGKISEEVL